MKSRKPFSRAFTLIEMLAVIAIVTFLAALLLPALNRTQAKARRVQCLNNLRQAGLGFHSFYHDHNDGFPMQVSTNQGGTMESLESAYRSDTDFYFSYVHFQSLSNDLSSPRIFVCPADPKRSAISDFAYLRNRNLSYFVGANADYGLANSILAGDRNISGAGPAHAGGVVRLNESEPANWSREMHGLKGNALFADGHSERANGPVLKLARRNAPAVMDLMLPLVKPGAAPPAALAFAPEAEPGLQRNPSP